MHLTNYSLQKDKPNFKVSDNVNEGTKRALSSFLKEMMAKHKTQQNNSKNAPTHKTVPKRKSSTHSTLHPPSPTFDVDQFWIECSDIISASLFALKPQLAYAYQSSLKLPKTKTTFQDIEFRCFQILGFDIMMDKNLKLHLIEGNCAPSLNIYTKDINQPSGKYSIPIYIIMMTKKNII